MHKSRGASPGCKLVYPDVSSQSTWPTKRVCMIDAVAICVLSTVQEEHLLQEPDHIGRMMVRALIKYMEEKASLLVARRYVSVVYVIEGSDLLYILQRRLCDCIVSAWAVRV